MMEKMASWFWFLVLVILNLPGLIAGFWDEFRWKMQAKSYTARKRKAEEILVRQVGMATLEEAFRDASVRSSGRHDPTAVKALAKEHYDGLNMRHLTTALCTLVSLSRAAGYGKDVERKIAAAFILVIFKDDTSDLIKFISALLDMRQEGSVVRNPSAHNFVLLLSFFTPESSIEIINKKMPSDILRSFFLKKSCVRPLDTIAFSKMDFIKRHLENRRVVNRLLGSDIEDAKIKN